MNPLVALLALLLGLLQGMAIGALLRRSNRSHTHERIADAINFSGYWTPVRDDDVRAAMKGIVKAIDNAKWERELREEFESEQPNVREGLADS